MPRVEITFFARSIYFCGLIIFFTSFFSYTAPREMIGHSEGREVKTWESSLQSHLTLAFEPFGRAVDFVNATNNPSAYGSEERGDGYDYFVKELVYRFFYSVPSFIGWWTIWLSILLSYWLVRGKLQNRVLNFLLTVGSFFMLIAVPLLAYEFYVDATVYKPYFHLGIGAYLIVGAYFLIGMSILLLLGTTTTKKSSIK